MLIFLLLVVFILIAEHNYRHWAAITGETLPHPKRLILNYITGTLAWFTPFSLWLLANSLWREFLTGWVFVSVAGMTVVSLYVHDAKITEREKLEDENERLRREREQSRDAGTSRT
jgi:hypothetical protein